MNVKGLFNVVQAFLPSRNVGATLIGINTRTLQLDHMSKGFSAYNSSKIATLKVLQTLADENLDLHVVAMHPGVSKSFTSQLSLVVESLMNRIVEVDSDMTRKV